jgi:hypothetical protein
MTSTRGVHKVGLEVSIATVRLWRTVVGAGVGAVGALLLTPLAGMVWGAIIQAAPCTGGADYSVADRVIGGALFGMLVFVEWYGGYLALAGVVVGAAGVNLLPRARCAVTQRVLSFLYPRRGGQRAS